VADIKGYQGVPHRLLDRAMQALTAHPCHDQL